MTCLCTLTGHCPACEPQRVDVIARAVADQLNRLVDSVPYGSRPAYPGSGWSDPGRLDQWVAAPQFSGRPVSGSAPLPALGSTHADASPLAIGAAAGRPETTTFDEMEVDCG